MTRIIHCASISFRFGVILVILLTNLTEEKQKKKNPVQAKKAGNFNHCNTYSYNLANRNMC